MYLDPACPSFSLLWLRVLCEVQEDDSGRPTTKATSAAILTRASASAGDGTCMFKIDIGFHINICYGHI